MKQKEIIYYKDELNEEFSTAKTLEEFTKLCAIIHGKRLFPL